MKKWQLLFAKNTFICYIYFPFTIKQLHVCAHTNQPKDIFLFSMSQKIFLTPTIADFYKG